MLAIWRFEATFFVVADGVADVIHHHPREEAGFGVFGDEVVFGAGAPEDAGVNAKHGDDAVVFFFVFAIGKDGGWGWDEAVWHKLLDFGRVRDFVKEESAVWFDDERHLAGFLVADLIILRCRQTGSFFSLVWR